MGGEEKIPRCVGIIMDGNRRWARERGFGSLEGHREGYENLKRFVEWAGDAGIATVVAYAFSTENWNRSEEEVGYLIKLLRDVLENEIDELVRRGIRLRFVGDRTRFAQDIQDLMRRAEEKTAKAGDKTLVLALSYGGRAELIDAAKRFARETQNPDSAGEEDFAKCLWTCGIPDPDLVIRAGGRYRLSNFLPWQTVYSELYFTDTLWPAFTKEEFQTFLDRYAESVQNYGR